MPGASDFLRSSLCTEVGERIRQRLGAGGEADSGVALLGALLGGMGAADLEQAPPQALYGATMSLLAFARRRRTRETLVRIFDPDPDRDGWVSAHSIVEIVNDDMPFLVDSVANALAGRGIAVHLLVHPILNVSRDEAGVLRDIRPADGEPLESLMHIQVDRQEPAAHAALAAALRAVLADVRAAVEDWQPMREELKAATVALSGRAVSEDPELAEAVAFLDWLRRNHFTFLGYRRFHLPPDGAVVVEEPRLGVLRDAAARVFDDTVPLAAMPPDIHAFLRRADLLLVTKSARVATVHRSVHMDVIGVKRLDESGQVCGLHAFIGLFTAAAYTMNPADIPLLRRKVGRVLTRAGFPFGSHDAKALANILETYPRDELFQTSDDALLKAGLGIVRLIERSRVALFVRHDEFERFVSCLVFVPRDRYDTPLRLGLQALLESAYGGSLAFYATQVADFPLARLHMVIRVAQGGVPAVDERELEARIAELARNWSDHLQDALVHAHGEATGLALARRYGQAFPASYRERMPAAAAVADIEHVEQVASGDDVALTLSQPIEASAHQARIKLYHRGDTIPLSGVMPMLEAMGLRVIAEVPHELRLREKGARIWINEFEVETPDGAPIALETRRADFEETLIRVWHGEAESDGFNRLVLAAGLTWREVATLRAYAKYMRQAGTTTSQGNLERALGDNPAVAAALAALFAARFDPAGAGDAAAADARAEAVLAAVGSAEDDRILRRFLNLIRSTLRTNFYQPDSAGRPKGHLSFKLDSRAIEDLPLPRPLVEIWVYSPRVEAVHLRGGRVARGGIRWSDRREDFRTEILSLMKAQMVKNAVIVPVGAKGGFVVKTLAPESGRDAWLAEGIACYRIMMHGLLDLTDNLVAGVVQPPPAVVRHDGDDPYLVVAADKGTARFSDIANEISAEYGFWLGDAFASGGSHGYDHKALGITARGTWTAVERHFREMGRDCATQPFTVAGIGDMSGDVFGNGMLQSRAIRLVAAFNHSHVFIDPDPDPERSFAERERLYRAGRAWAEYDPAAVSAGGGVFARAAKSIPLSPQMKALFGLDRAVVSPAELIRAILCLPVDLLFFGGIGTYVKAHGESNADVGDRANDPLRVDGRALRAKVVGEGANLAMTQAGRIEYALAGGRLDTDAIHNSAGVDTSDHEVNIKILLDGVVAAGDLTGKQRDALLAEMADEVAGLVLRDNLQQTQALSLMEAQAADLLDAQARFMRLLEKAGRLDRGLEVLPDDETLVRRAAARAGLVRPELAVLLAYAKIWLYDAVLHSSLPDDPFLAQDLARYFPHAIQARFAAEIGRHRLHREIVATGVTNSMVNRLGVAGLAELQDKTGAEPADLARAYVAAREAYGLRELWQAIEAVGPMIPAATGIAMLAEANRLLERVIPWILRSVPAPFDTGAVIEELSHGIVALEAALAAIMPAELAETVAARTADFVARGVPDVLAARVANLIVLASAADIVRIARRHGLGVVEAGGLYFAVGARFGLGRLRAAAQMLAVRGRWEKLAAAAAIEDLYGHQRDITTAVAAAAVPDPLATWTAAHPVEVGRTDALLAELNAAAQIDLPMLAVVNRQLRALSDMAG